ncbi:MAG TPA: DUF1460 domain-containing protein [Syntrophales bacterium]|nr:DUF1460 domain-containing protein [Syntrophales bacterium]HOL59724.1 DUF1460 domain-containing protein [Syntrophales bacterium]HPO35870.1 DUF1460 domain-containing protein [Syntrophales bacterium]
MVRLEDVVVYQSVLDSIFTQDKDRGSILAEVASFFLEADYQASPLEVGEEEVLTINLRAFDCFTFVEQCLGIALILTDFRRSWEDYSSIVRRLRYRDGRVEYPARFHYFSDWLNYHVANGLIRNVTTALGGVPYRKQISYLTTHIDLYPRLRDQAIFDRIRSVEEELGKSLGDHLPLHAVEQAVSSLKEGDIIAFTTDTEGLDVSHVGIFAKNKEEEAFLIHASREKGKVVKSPFLEYVKHLPGVSGIVVGRLA